MMDLMENNAMASIAAVDVNASADMMPELITVGDGGDDGYFHHHEQQAAGYLQQPPPLTPIPKESVVLFNPAAVSSSIFAGGESSLQVKTAATMILGKVREFHERQELININQAKINSFTVAIGLANQLRTAHLERENLILGERISKGEMVVRELLGEIEEHEGKIGELTDKSERQENAIEELTMRLVRQQNELIQLSNEMTSQRELIESQRAMNIKHDFVVDCIIVLMSGAFVNSPLVALPLYTLEIPVGVAQRSLFLFARAMSRIGQTASKQEMAQKQAQSLASTILTSSILLRKTPRVFNKLSKMIIFLIMIRSLRMMAHQKGVHNLVGGVDSYLKLGSQLNFRETLYNFAAGGVDLPSSIGSTTSNIASSNRNSSNNTTTTNNNNNNRTNSNNVVMEST